MDIQSFDQLTGLDRMLADLAEKARIGQLGSITIVWNEKSDLRPKVQVYNINTLEDLKTQAIGVMAADNILRAKIGVRGWGE